MNVLVNGTILNVTNAYAERDTVSGIITCTVIAPQSEADYADLKALFKGNTDDIIYTKEDESTELFSGFSFASILDDDANEQYIVKLTADEYSFQLGRNRQLEKDNANQKAEIASKDMEITSIKESVLEKETEIEAMTNEISEKKDIIEKQGETIEELETEISELLSVAEEYADMLYKESIEFSEIAEREVD